MISGLDHIGIAVADLAEGLRNYVDRLGFSHHETEEVPTEKVRVAILGAGSSRVELLEPTSPDSPIARFLEKRGQGGVHHLAFGVDDAQAEVTRLREKGVRFIEPAPRPGAGGCLVAFIHPQSAGGVLLELVERPLVP